jgi:hypothetical protein
MPPDPRQLREEIGFAGSASQSPGAGASTTRTAGSLERATIHG